jgi:hypothetical protein
MFLSFFDNFSKGISLINLQLAWVELIRKARSEVKNESSRVSRKEPIFVRQQFCKLKQVNEKKVRLTFFT